MPSRAYTFRDLVAFSGSDKNPVTNWVQKGAIPADLGTTTGTGVHRSFSFFNVFEACIAQKLNQLPGGMPLRELTLALDAVRIHAFEERDAKARRERVREQLARLPEDEAKEAVLLSTALSLAPVGRQYFGDFLNPDTRDPEARFWLVWSPRLGFGLLVHSQAMLDEMLADIDIAVVVNLHALIVDLEQRTGDHWVYRSRQVESKSATRATSE